MTVLLLCAALGALLPAPRAQAADMSIHVIQLHNRTADEVIPLIKPFLAPGAAASGTGYKLIVKTTPDNLQAIRTLLNDIDGGLRQLLITVRQNAAGSGNQVGTGVSGEIGVGGHGRGA